MNDFTWLWAIWLGLFGVIEGAALFNKKKHDTLSEHVWRFLGLRGYKLPAGYKWRRGALAAFFVWLIDHFFIGMIS